MELLLILLPTPMIAFCAGVKFGPCESAGCTVFEHCGVWMFGRPAASGVSKGLVEFLEEVRESVVVTVEDERLLVPVGPENGFFVPPNKEGEHAAREPLNPLAEIALEFSGIIG